MYAINKNILDTSYSHYNYAYIFMSCIDFFQVEPSSTHQIKLNLRLKMAVPWDVATCSLSDIDRRLKRAYCLHHQGSKQLSNVGQYLSDYTAQHPEESHLHTRRCVNIKSHQI
jgi:hypothetical protein